MRNAHLKTVRKLWKEYVDSIPVYQFFVNGVQFCADIFRSQRSYGERTRGDTRTRASSRDAQTCFCMLVTRYCVRFDLIEFSK